MTKRQQKPSQLSAVAILAGRPLTALSAEERTQLRAAMQREGQAEAQAIADNLNRNVMARGR